MTALLRVWAALIKQTNDDEDNSKGSEKAFDTTHKVLDETLKLEPFSNTFIFVFIGTEDMDVFVINASGHIK
jgi:hypothetical protein